MLKVLFSMLIISAMCGVNLSEMTVPLIQCKSRHASTILLLLVLSRFFRVQHISAL
jgi:hypothetical protein